MNTRNLTVSLLAVGVLAGVAGCGDSGAGAAPVVTPSPTLAVPTKSGSTAPGPAASPTSNASASASAAPSQQPSVAGSVTPHASATSLPATDVAAAEQAYRGWRAVMDKHSQNPGEANTDLSQFANGVALTESQQILASMKSQGVRVVGTTGVASQQVISTGGNGSGSVVRLRVCEDSTKLKILDSKGKEIPPTELRRNQADYLIVSQGDDWKVNYIDTKGVKC